MERGWDAARFQIEKETADDRGFVVDDDDDDEEDAIRDEKEGGENANDAIELDEDMDLRILSEEGLDRFREMPTIPVRNFRQIISGSRLS